MWANRFGENATTVDGTLEANVVCFLRNGNQPIVLVALDALYVGRDLIDRVTELTSAVVPSDSIVFCASHTHFGPVLSSDKPALGEVTTDSLVNDLAREIAESIRSVVLNPIPLKALQLRQAQVGRVINRRRRRWVIVGRRGVKFNQIVMSPNEAGRTNTSLSIIECLDADGEARAVLWSWACHPTAYPVPGVASPEYPGYVRDHIREHFNDPELPVIFFQGFSGDQRPPEPTKPRGIKPWILRILHGPTFQFFTPAQYWAWIDEIKVGVTKILESAPTRLDPAVDLATSQEPIGGFLSTETWLPDPKAVRLRLADSLAIVGVSAEVVLDHSDQVNQLWPDSTNICAGCVGDVYGYMATSAMVKEGGYEVNGFCRGFGYAPGTASPDIDSVFLRLLRKLKD